MSSAFHPTRLPCGNRVLDLTHPQVMGILNVTPDSFSDGGRFAASDAALRHAEAMAAAGAAIIDVGGESTRPGAAPVSVAQELDRVIPVIERIHANLDVLVSVDTSAPEVMRAATSAGAGLINDVRSLRRPGALQAAAESKAAVCLMHMQGEPGTMQAAPSYDSVVREVAEFLEQRMELALQAGIAKERIVLDPGFGFAKNLTHNLVLFRHLPKLLELGRPLLVGVSRKSMIGQVLDRRVDERLAGSLALAGLAFLKGARIIRVHDVRETRDVLRMIEAVETAEEY